MPVILGGNTGIYLASLAPAIDPDAQAFITAASITDPTQKSAINQLVVDLKGYNIWTKMKALYPFVGGTASQHKWNLKDPRDLDAAFRLVFSGGWTHSSTGALPNGTNGYADTFLTPSTSLILNNSHLSVYSRTDSVAANRVTVGSNNQDYTRYNLIALKWSDGKGSFAIDNGVAVTPTITDSRGFFSVSRTANNLIKAFRNNVSLGTNTTNSIGLNTNKIQLSCILESLGGYRSSYDNKQLAFASIGDGLTDTDAANLYTAVQAFQTTLGRSIGTQTVSDADAQAFVTNAGIVDQVEANAINNLVIGLKADGLWTKMKAVYPFVGGTSTSNSYNLKNTAQYQITWFGGATHTANGVGFNGTNSYGNTGYNQTTVGDSLNSAHLSYYSRTNSNGAEVEIGLNAGGSYNLLEIRTSGVTYFFHNQNGSTSASDANSIGFYLGNRQASNDIDGWKNGLKVVNGTTASTFLPNVNIFIGAMNQTGAVNYTTKQCAFASIGSGLTDTEAANLYSRVQTFNTALARQV